MPETIDIDIRGQLCPSCLLLTLRELNQHVTAIRAGDTEVVVVTDDRQATATIPAAADRMGLMAQVDRLDELYRIRVFGNP
ncbi:MAG: sulfurtransferase TusA family protein [Thiobacillus sp.]|nr:sulfurtransferase TusA family protein [Thiobacillus sp.]